jgi:hypothetical protein
VSTVVVGSIIIEPIEPVIPVNPRKLFAKDPQEESFPMQLHIKVLRGDGEIEHV